MSLNFAKQNSLPPFLPPSNGKGVFFGQEKKVRKKWQKKEGIWGLRKDEAKKEKRAIIFSFVSGRASVRLCKCVCGSASVYVCVFGWIVRDHACIS